MDSHLPVTDQEALIPVYQGCLYFLPLATVLDLLHTPTLQRNLYEQAHRPGWLTWKTFSKWFTGCQLTRDMRPTQKLKLEKMLQSRPALTQLQQEIRHKDALWRPYAEWLGLIGSPLFNSKPCVDYWKDKLETEWHLACKLLPCAPSGAAKLAVLAASTLAEDLGTPSSRARLEALLASKLDDHALTSHADFVHTRLADSVATLLRFAAWLTADAVVLNEALMQQGSVEDSQPLIRWLPRLTSDPSEWSNPLGECIEHFVRLAGCSDTAALGELWAQHEYQQGKVRDITSKQRLLRDWINGGKGRPSLTSVRSLAEAVAMRTAALQGIADSQGGREVDALRQMLHFAETIRFLQKEMLRLGLPAQLIGEVFSTYPQEYRKALMVLGHPLP
ncbi:hypothetical protein DNK59_16205 [Pseudomonas sp. TKO26]|uniref:hypothetical protein n=1 Tax=unclassified Pseudomonas TaxID=196821 RepID=UPI000D8A3084|nr:MULTISPECIES: hypothetical protein [unclassified Pseudomonas]PYY84790.1 hypothetical protein DNK62_16205 [Pseudomonas sp. TKO30]PYY86698.1 hypothetical protein DNK61_16200 [Pseudomonas sp. TKO29]PYY89341.1 hypothetical protein DNK59_16205 [Pseudomonas sp. TKO26]PYY99170.1 hypothetical protein DNK60_16195 [Pseudomonas sp. TKO14]